MQRVASRLSLIGHKKPSAHALHCRRSRALAEDNKPSERR
jgi:hypothetical protein